MTKQHFTTIAETFNLSFRNAPSGQAEKILETLAVNLADDFEKVNPRFSRSKFLAVALA
mgnify:CR=1 FL=1|tara:strand:+ start:1924 stop:2100 length:177 start_codon:yes stop_codon:yes gene_type:complete